MSSINGTCTDCSTDSCLITGFLYKTLWQEVDPTNIAQGTKFNGNVTVTGDLHVEGDLTFDNDVIVEGCVKTDCINYNDDPNKKITTQSNWLFQPEIVPGNTEAPIRNFELVNRNLAICDANGNGPVGYPAVTTDPRWGYNYMLVNGGSDFRDIVRIRKSQNYNSSFNKYGIALQVTSPQQAIGEDIAIQLGRDFVSQNNAGLIAFRYAGDGSPLNTLRIDTNGNQDSITPSFVITMPPVPQLGNVGIHIAQPQYPLDIQGDTAIRNINTGNIIMYVDAANGDFTLNASDTTRMMYLDGNSTSFSIGKGSGVTQGTNSLAIGPSSGILQGNNSVAVGSGAGGATQGNSCVAVGVNCGITQGNQSIAVGNSAGQNTQGEKSVAIGTSCALNTQGNEAVAIGYFAGKTTQAFGGIAIGVTAGETNQGQTAISIGYGAGQTNQTQHAVAIGRGAGNTTQGQDAVALGRNAGVSTQGLEAVAVGKGAGSLTQSAYAVSIGPSAGNTGQGSSAIAIGALAGYTNQHANSIILNATGSTLNSTAASQFLVSNLRTLLTSGGQDMFYNPTTKEIHYNQYRYGRPVKCLDKANQIIPNGVDTVIVFDALKFGDLGTTAAPPSDDNSGVPLKQDSNGYFVNLAGVPVTVNVCASVTFASFATGYRFIAIYAYDNATPAKNFVQMYAPQTNPASQGRQLSTSFTFTVPASYAFAIVVHQTQGNSLTAENAHVSIIVP